MVSSGFSRILIISLEAALWTIVYLIPAIVGYHVVSHVIYIFTLLWTLLEIYGCLALYVVSEDPLEHKRLYLLIKLCVCMPVVYVNVYYPVDHLISVITFFALLIISEALIRIVVAAATKPCNLNYVCPSWDRSNEPRHIIITGGSSGIGLECARLLLLGGQYVTIIARDESKLGQARSILLQSNEQYTDMIQIISADVSDYESIDEGINKAIEGFGIDCAALICCAGTSIPKKFDDLGIDDFKSQIDVNYLGCVNSIKAVMPIMKLQEDGRIILISSQVGQTGMFGYTAYSPTKFALRGLAESLYQELRPYGIHVSVSYPPDTYTPGYRNEMKMKPEETKKMSESGSVWNPDDVAWDIVKSLWNYKFNIYHGFDGYILSTLSGGCEPPSSFFDELLKCISFPLLRFVWTYYYVNSWYKIALKYKDNKKFINHVRDSSTYVLDLAPKALKVANISSSGGHDD